MTSILYKSLLNIIPLELDLCLFAGLSITDSGLEVIHDRIEDRGILLADAHSASAENRLQKSSAVQKH